VTITNSRSVNIRNGPGTQYQQIGEACPDTGFYFTDVEENDFVQILYPNIRSNSGHNVIANVGPQDFRVEAYVAKSLVAISLVTPQDTVLSSLVGNLKVKSRTKIFHDAALSKSSKGAFDDVNCVPFLGIMSNGTYSMQQAP